LPPADSQPLSEKNDNPQPNRSPSPVPKAPPVPVPPPASIPVPPPVSIPEPIAPNTLMPEPMSPGGFNANSPSGSASFSQRVGSLSEKLPSWAPYLVIGIGVIALIAILVFFFSGSKKEENHNNQPAIENNDSQQVKEDIENVVPEPLQNTEDNKEVANESTAIDNENSETEPNNTNSPVLEDANNGENLTPENEKTEDSALTKDKIDNNEETNINNEPVENVENNNDVEETEPQLENNAEDDNPFQEVEQDSDVNPEQTAPEVDNPDVIDEGAEALENDVTPDDSINNASNPEGEPAEDSNTESNASSIPGLDLKLKSITIREQKLSQCLQTIRELGALPIEVNWDSLRRNGVNADDKISWSGKDVTLKTALSEVLAQRGLMFKINESEKIVFVPRVSINARSDSGVNAGEQGGSAMVKAQYSVSDLVGQSPDKTAELIKSIREFLCPGDWKEVGGTGTIASSGGGSVMVTQSQQNQWIIADFLDRLRLARHLAPLYNRDASLEPMSVRAQSALKRNVGINFQPSADLKTALSEIGQRIGVTLLLDEPSLKIAGISAQFPISFDAREMSLEETLNRINEETGLTYLAQTPNSFIVTTMDGAKSMMAVEFYPISDLVNIGLTPAVLMEQIVKFEPKSWKSQDAASFGLIDFDSRSDCLIVRQSPSVLNKITELLTQLRARLKEKE
ncbi:MAG: hypothetical protein IKS45_13460, partial [Thermoguttaceae bacterium]|nr:hypothetical protein [Thermoguttaceae bacterium]